MDVFHSSRWLCNTSVDARTRKWAVEGLAYLTLDADVKDDFVEDEPALQAMFELAKVYLLTLFPHSFGSIKFSQLSSPTLFPSRRSYDPQPLTSSSAKFQFCLCHGDTSRLLLSCS